MVDLYCVNPANKDNEALTWQKGQLFILLVDFFFIIRDAAGSNNCLFSTFQALASSGSRMKCSKLPDLPAGYRPVTIGQRDLDRCDVCHMDEVSHFLAVFTFLKCMYHDCVKNVCT